MFLELITDVCKLFQTG